MRLRGVINTVGSPNLLIAAISLSCANLSWVGPKWPFKKVLGICGHHSFEWDTIDQIITVSRYGGS
ncbi:MAG: hypothetical protein CL797_08715 [Chromatiales bacterium]|nr:hypothetical protein [Chromatiales bacterium]